MTLRSLFEKGQYSKGLEIPSKSLKTEDLPWLLGCAVFVGDWSRVQSVVQRIPKIPSLMAPTLYFEALAALRRSDYARARALLKKNLGYRSQLKGREEEFFLDQGPALYFYFRGDFEKSARFGEKAFTWAEESDFIWGEIVSRDLLAHVYFHSGRVRASFDFFARASEKAQRLQNQAILSALEISRLKYSCQVGLWGGESIQRLESSLESLHPSDTYSKAEFLMELSRQRILRGQMEKAEAALKEAFPLVHQFQNKRQTARLNFRLAYLQYLRGQDLAALGILRAGMALLDAKVDHVVLNEMLGLEFHITGDPAEPVGGQTAAGHLTCEREPVFWQRRINARLNGKTGLLAIGEDPLGDLLDLIQSAPDKAAPIVRREEYWGLLPGLLKLGRNENALVVGFIPRGLAMISSGEVVVKRQGLTNLMARQIRVLSDGRKSKEELIQHIWGYTYDPLRHDSLLHRALATLRKLLHPFEDWLQFDGEHYSLKDRVRIHDSLGPLGLQKETPKLMAIDPADEGAETTSKTPKAASFDYKTQLNHRQNLFLKNWPVNLPIDVRAYAENFQVSVPSATRDLSSLLSEGFVKRIGRARGTKYIRS